MQKIIRIFYLLIFILISFKSISQNNQPKKNILFIIIDDLGYADFTAYKNSDPNVVSPNIKRLAQKGERFTQAYVTAPVCSPSRVGMLTGKNQFRWDKPAGCTGTSG